MHRATRTLPWLASLGLLTAFLLASAAGALANGTHGEAHYTVTTASGDDCPDGKSLCFIVDGPAAVAAGESVEVTFVNEDSQVHNFFVDKTGDYDADNADTSTSAAEANTEDVDPGNQTTLTFTAPTDRDDFYTWCDIPGHEAGGMWTKFTVTGADTGGNGDGGNGDGTTTTPGFGVLAALAAAGIAGALSSRYRRR